MLRREFILGAAAASVAAYAPAPALADVQDQIRQTLADNAIQATLAAARAKVKVTINNPDGTPSASTAPASN